MAVETRKMCRRKQSSCFFPLPPDIIADILLRLPTKSIGKLRCVCKQWLSLTCDPHFLKSHHERSSMMIISTHVADGKIKLYNVSIGDRKYLTESSYALNNLERKYWSLSNFVDGLTCVYNNAYHDIYLLNPTTRELQKLPKKRDSHNKCCKRKRLLLKSVGLGYDMTAGQRKVVTVFRFSERDHLQCDVYSTGTKQWRCLGETPFEFTTCTSQALHHGHFHWIGYHRKTREMGVFRFDIKDEKFGSAISIPSASAPIACFFLKESGGKLWLAFRNYFEGYFEIWSMKDLNETWVKEYKFNDRLSSLHISSTTEFLDDEIILTSNAGPSKWHVIRYNPRSGVVHKIFDATTFADVAIYRESLISPKKLLKLSPKT